MQQVLERTTFETSRLLEFFSEKELTMQIGHYKEVWSIAIVKELIDNALDACETANLAPVVDVEVGDHWFSVKDNGPGLPEKTLERSLDYMVRVSDKLHYISPTRGQLGNALKCVYAAPFVVDGAHGRVQVETGEVRYTIDVTLDRIAQTPSLDVTEDKSPGVHGTKVTVFWPDSSRLQMGLGIGNSYNDLGVDLFSLLAGYSMFNPHATLTVTGLGYEGVFEATDTDWRKWKPDNPTSAHWYDADSLRSLIAAYLVAERNGDRAMTVREFVSEFRGLAGTAKQKRVTEAAGLHGKELTDLVDGGDVAIGPVERLLSAMKEHSKPVKPKLLGAVGKEHISRQMVDGYRVTPESIRYKKIANVDEETGLPHLLEMGFGIYQESDEKRTRKIITGLNWAPTLGIPVAEFQAMLGEMRIDRHDPVCVVLHIARPRFEFVDRGKGRLDV